MRSCYGAFFYYQILCVLRLRKFIIFVKFALLWETFRLKFFIIKMVSELWTMNGDNKNEKKGGGEPFSKQNIFCVLHKLVFK